MPIDANRPAEITPLSGVPNATKPVTLSVTGQLTNLSGDWRGYDSTWDYDPPSAVSLEGGARAGIRTLATPGDLQMSLASLSADGGASTGGES